MYLNINYKNINEELEQLPTFLHEVISKIIEKVYKSKSIVDGKLETHITQEPSENSIPEKVFIYQKHPKYDNEKLMEFYIPLRFSEEENNIDTTLADISKLKNKKLILNKFNVSIEDNICLIKVVVW
jgi:hypothetical protein